VSDLSRSKERGYSKRCQYVTNLHQQKYDKYTLDCKECDEKIKISAHSIHGF
jgi:hypothetical protein